MSYRFENNKEFHVWDIETYENIKAENINKSWIAPYTNEKLAVLDIGCGPGYFVKLLQLNGIKVLGIDLNDESIEQAKKEGLFVEKIDAFEAIGKYKDEFNFFSMSDFIEHVPLEVVVGILQKIKEIPGVKVYMSTPNLDSLMGFKFWFHMPTHINAMNPYVIRQMLLKLGYTIEREWSDDYGKLPGNGWKLRIRKFILEKLFGPAQAPIFYGGGNICFIART